MRAWRGIRFVVLFVLVPTVAATAIYVVVVAMFDPPRHQIDPEKYRLRNWLHSPDAEVGFQPMPNRHVVLREPAATTVVYTDDRGARVDGPGTPHQNRADIVTVGGSLSWGHGLANRFTFTSVLARNLGATVSNLSVSGFGGVQSMLRLRRNLDLRPRLVLYAMWEDHLRRNLRRCMTVSFPGCLQVPAVRYVHDSRPDILFPKDLPENFDLMRRWYLEASGGPETTFWTDTYWTADDIFHRASVFFGEPEIDIENPFAQLRAAEFVLQQMKAIADGVDARLVVIYIPNYLGKGVTPMPPALAELFETLGIIVVNMEERFVRMKAEGEVLGIPGDGHFTRRAHAAVAEEVRAAIERENIDWHSRR